MSSISRRRACAGFVALAATLFSPVANAKIDPTGKVENDPPLVQISTEGEGTSVIMALQTRLGGKLWTCSISDSPAYAAVQDEKGAGFALIDDRYSVLGIKTHKAPMALPISGFKRIKSRAKPLFTI